MKRTLLSEAQVESILEKVLKQTAFEKRPLPFSSLGDREFEVLIYQIFQEKIQRGDSDVKGIFDHVDLMEGVGEKGRDSVLLFNQKNVGVIQCKKINGNITKPSFAKEIIKFAIHCTQDKSLIHKAENFHYYFAVSKGLAGSTKQLIREFNEKILIEKDLDKWIKEVLKSYKSFENLTVSKIKKELLKILSNIKVHRVLPEDIELWLNTMPELLSFYFETKKVVENELIQQLEKKYLIPIIKKLKIEEEKDVQSFHINFTEYLTRSYEYYSSTRTLVFGNQQRRLEDFYYPLDLVCEGKTYKTKAFPSGLLDTYKKVILVDSGGMGKSTVTKWMFTSAIKENIGIPVFIELRSLNKDNLLINQIIKEISPLDKTISRKILLELIKNGDFIFFFDGYDEIRMSDRSIITKDLNSFISKANKNQFIITSRPENAENSFGDFQLCKIKQLSIPDAYKLIEKIGDYGERSNSLIKKIKENKLKDIKEFLKNPLLISLLYKKFNYRASVPLKKQEFYYEVFEALFKEHDITKGTDSFERVKKSGLSFSDFGKVLRLLGFRSVQENEIEYNKTVLYKLLEQIENELPNINFDPNLFIEDLITTVPLFQKIGLNYKWAHKSIQEYFAAEYICTDTKGEQEDVLLAIYKGERLQSLIHVMDLCYDIDPRTFRNSVLNNLCVEFITFANSTFQPILQKGTIPEADIRDRQFRMFIDDNYLLRSEKTFKKTNELKKFFVPKIPKETRFSNRVSSDFYYTGSVKKRDHVRRMLTLLRSKGDPLIKDSVKKDLQYQNKDGRFNKSQISLFNGDVNDEIIMVNDDEKSPVNNPDYFHNISIFLRSSFFSYEECVSIIEKVKKDRKLLKKKSLTAGF